MLDKAFSSKAFCSGHLKFCDKKIAATKQIINH